MSLVIDVDEIITAAVGTSSRPESWKRARLGDVGTVLNGFAFPSARFSKSRGTPLIRIRDVGSGSTACNYDGSFDPCFLIHPGDLLVGMDGEFKAARWSGPDALLNQRVCKIDVDPRFFEPHLLDLILPAYLKAIHGNTSSQTVTHLSSRTVLELPLPLPPLAEQRRIVDKVEALLARVSAARERLQRVPKLLKRFRQAVLAAACEGRLTEGWRDSNRPAVDGRTLLDAIASEVASARQRVERKNVSELDPEPLELPAAWAWGAASDVCESITDGDHQAPPKSDSGVPFITIGNLRGGRLSLEDTYFVPHNYFANLDPTRRPRKGDVLYTVTASYGIPVIVDTKASFCFQRHIALLRVHPAFSAEFLHLALASELSLSQATQVATGIAQLTVPLSGVRALRIPVPPYAEQVEIVRRVQALISLADTIERRVAAALARAEKLPQAILSRAFAGELVPTEAELARVEGRSYETAEELLRRIRREREAEVAPKQRKAPPLG